MNILVIGGTGMIGQGVVQAFAEHGHRVAVLHRGHTKAALPPVEILQLDRSSSQMEKLFRERSFDIVVDLACYDAASADNLIRILPAEQRLVVASTVLVTGGPVARPISERSPVSTLSGYARSKSEMESVLQNADRSGRIRCSILRLGACYREGCYLDGQIFEDTYWIHAIKTGRPSILAGDGRISWSVLHAEDAGEAIVRLAMQSRAYGEIVLVANPQTITWRRYYELGAETLDRRLDVQNIDTGWLIDELGKDCFLAEMSAWDQHYDLTKLESLIGSFRPQIGLEDGLARTLKVYTENRRIRPNASTSRMESILKRWNSRRS